MAEMKLHPGARVAVDRLSMDELDVARAIAAGDLSSPQRYMNVTLFAIRITGTGAAYRESLDEYVWRDPKLYLTDRFCARCAGLAVIMSHPPDNALNTKEFRERNVGAIMLAWIRGDEVWGIAKIHDDDAAKVIAERGLSTSPAVVFKAGDGNRKFRREDGSTLLVEGDPSLLDHIAICEEGVWDKGRGPGGVDSTHSGDKETDMPDDNDKKLDKILGAMDNVGSRVDALGARMDAIEKTPPPAKIADAEGCSPEMMQKLDDDAASRKDDDEPDFLKSMPEGTAADKTRKDAARAHWSSRKDTYKRRADADAGQELDDELKALCDAAVKRGDAEMPPELMARAGDRKDAAKKYFDTRRDAHRKDAALPEDLKDTLDKDAMKRDDGDDGEPKELTQMADGARKDSARTFHRGRVGVYRAVRENAVKPLAARLEEIASSIPRVVEEADRDLLAAAQARADSVYHMFGRSAPRPLQGEVLLDYRRRLAKGVQEHSPTWKDVHLPTLGAEAFDKVETQVYADAATSARNPADVPEDELREVTSSDATGRRITEFVGRPGAWMRDFSAGRRRVRLIRNS